MPGHLGLTVHRKFVVARPAEGAHVGADEFLRAIRKQDSIWRRTCDRGGLGGAGESDPFLVRLDTFTDGALGFSIGAVVVTSIASMGADGCGLATGPVDVSGASLIYEFDSDESILAGDSRTHQWSNVSRGHEGPPSQFKIEG
jgi:hypothetical protein